MTDPRQIRALHGDWQGRLQDHWQSCTDCGGTGRDEDYAGEEYDDDSCCECDGHGGWRWGSYWVQDRGECESCQTEDALIGRVCDEQWWCLPCYVRIHNFDCRCGLWRWMEELLGAAPAPGDGRGG